MRRFLLMLLAQATLPFEFDGGRVLSVTALFGDLASGDPHDVDDSSDDVGWTPLTFSDPSA
jgi:hypothetical protein